MTSNTNDAQREFDERYITSSEIMEKLGGTIAYLPGQGGAAFRLVLPAAAQRAA
jgi:hypothetical protein